LGDYLADRRTSRQKNKEYKNLFQSGHLFQKNKVTISEKNKNNPKKHKKKGAFTGAPFSPGNFADYPSFLGIITMGALQSPSPPVTWFIACSSSISFSEDFEINSEKYLIALDEV